MLGTIMGLLRVIREIEILAHIQVAPGFLRAREGMFCVSACFFSVHMISANCSSGKGTPNSEP